MIDGPPPNHSPELLIDDVSKKVEDKFKNLVDVAEGDAQPGREAATAGNSTPVCNSGGRSPTTHISLPHPKCISSCCSQAEHPDHIVWRG